MKVKPVRHHIFWQIAISYHWKVHVVFFPLGSVNYWVLGKDKVMICSFVNRDCKLSVVYFHWISEGTRRLSANGKRMLCVSWSTQEQIPKHWGHSNEAGIGGLMDSGLIDMANMQETGWGGKKKSQYAHTYRSNVLPNPTGTLGGHFKIHPPCQLRPDKIYFMYGRTHPSCNT